MIPVTGLSLVSVECHGFYNKPIEIFKISGITLLGGLLCHMYSSDGPGGGSGGPGGHWASSAMGNISNTPVSEAGSIFPGTPKVQDHEEHHRDDQEQLLDNLLEVFKRSKEGLRGLIRSCFSCFLTSL